jgi:aryl-alcohol dehydrogenase-like predicted oxidoreductase
MRFRLLGRSGLRVSGICLGTMGFTEGQSWCTSKPESQRIYEAFRESGGNFVDTANTYGNGSSETYLGEFMAHEREAVVVMTKYTGSFLGSNGGKNPNHAGSHRKSLRHAVEGSLRRLRTDYIDVLSVHSWDFLTPLQEVLEGLDDLVRRGLVLYLGISNTPAWIVARANTLAELRGWTPFVGYTAECNLLERDCDRELLPMARAFDIAMMATHPLASGLLTGKYARELGNGSGGSRRLDDPTMARFVSRSERNLTIVKEVCAIAAEIGCQPAHVALNWLRQRDLIPVIGARSAAQVRENLACYDFALSAEQVQRLDGLSRIPLGYPHAFLASGIVKKFTYGEMRELMDDHRPALASVSH